MSASPKGCCCAPGRTIGVRQTFEFDNAPIAIGDGSWIATRATVLRGVTIGTDSVVGATTLVVKDVPSGQTVTHRSRSGSVSWHEDHSSSHPLHP